MSDRFTSDTARVRWRLSAAAVAVIWCAGTVFAMAVALNRPQLVVFAAPLAGVVLAAQWRPPETVVRVVADPADDLGHGIAHCFETDTIVVRLRLVSGGHPGGVALELPVVEGLASRVIDEEAARTTVVRVECVRWGRHRLAVRVHARARWGLLRGAEVVRPIEVRVFPRVHPRRFDPVRSTPAVLRHAGTHPSNRSGSGVEYADLRQFSPGDSLRTINWPVSVRQGSLYVTDRRVEQSVDLVVLLDTHTGPDGPVARAHDRSVRGAVEIVANGLRSGDRVGLVCLGADVRWIEAKGGRSQYFRALSMILGVDDAGAARCSGSLPPRAAAPPGAIVIAFSTLISTAFFLALIELRKRGHPIVVVDVLAGADLVRPSDDPLCRKLWDFERRGMYRDMRSSGLEVVAWPPEHALSEALTVRGPRRGRP
ncbi:DUF58 domain-containing protein [Nocardia sp. NPDC004068]|uniref:DUF58 domain-containing protein n=1 Tax=Nocardia sp. NPDC004068 TaxID=3364303 RepID=UPI00368EF05E